jgi:hypothetical protein
VIRRFHLQAEPAVERAFDMKGLLRLASWGVAATIALVVAVVTATSNSGSQRLMAAMSPQPSNQAKAIADVAQAARIKETQSETRRLSEAVRALNSDRERLLARLATLERNVEDVTGSVRRQSIAAVPPAAPAAPAEAPATAREPPATVPANPASGESGQQAAAPEAEAEEHAHGIDVGGAVNFEGLRVLWNSTRTTHAALVEGMRPLLATRENPKTRNTEFRLVIGPVPNAGAAASVCATLTAAKRYCQPAPFEGQQLSFAAPPAAPKRPPAAQEKKPATPGAAPPPRPPARPNP